MRPHSCCRRAQCRRGTAGVFDSFSPESVAGASGALTGHAVEPQLSIRATEFVPSPSGGGGQAPIGGPPAAFYGGGNPTAMPFSPGRPPAMPFEPTAAGAAPFDRDRVMAEPHAAAEPPR